MALSTSIRSIFTKLTGYYIYKQSHLPCGVDLKEDLENKFKILPKCIFDVGANYGQTALAYAAQFPEATIYSFEPVSLSYLKLVENTKNLSKIHSFHLALGDKSGEVEIKLYDETQSQLNSLKDLNTGNSALKETISVNTLTDFALKENIEKIDLLKIDTEGFELEVLTGSTTRLQDGSIGAILCEVALSGKNTRNTQLYNLINFLDSFDYFFVGLYETNINYFRQGLAYSNALFIKK